MSDVDMLRRAAALMRERAEAARAGRWFSEGDEVRADWTLVRQVATCHGSIDVGNTANADHIASWHPSVALAVADWLRAVSIDVSKRDNPQHVGGQDKTLRIPDERAALTVARAYLGETA